MSAASKALALLRPVQRGDRVYAYFCRWPAAPAWHVATILDPDYRMPLVSSKGHFRAHMVRPLALGRPK